MRKDGTLRFGDFVSAILHLSDAFGIYTFKSLPLFSTCYPYADIQIYFTGIFESKDPLQNGTIKLSLTEVCVTYKFYLI